MAAATVATPTPETSAVRTPAAMTAVASGNSTWTSTCRGVIPSASAASRTAGSTLAMPAIVPRTMGSSA